MKHDHSFMYVDIKYGAKAMSIQLLPMEKRLQHTDHMSVVSTDPLPILTEDSI